MYQEEDDTEQKSKKNNILWVSLMPIWVMIIVLIVLIIAGIK